MMQYNEKTLQELAERIYDLDAEVYAQLGSSLGRVFNRDREGCVRDMVDLMKNRRQGHRLRSELALISNMARTIQDRELRKMIMAEYNAVLQMVLELPTSFGEGDVMDDRLASLNAFNLDHRFGDTDHLIICIGRTYGSGGTEIGFKLADSLKINFYDAEIFSEVLKRLEAEKDQVEDRAGYGAGFEIGKKDEKKTDQKADQKAGKKPDQKAGDGERAFETDTRMTLKDRMREFSRYHGLSKRDAVFFNQSDLICDMAKKESFIVMGRCADVILTNNRIPHISIFITAPYEQRLHRAMEINSTMNEKQVRRLIRQMDHRHTSYYDFYTGRKWGSAVNYDLCLNSATYGIEGSVEFIRKMIRKES